MLLFLPWAPWALAASPPLPPTTVRLQLLLTTVFHNARATASQGGARLGDLETHTMDFLSGQIRFLQPWAHQGLTPKEWQDLGAVIRRILADFVRLLHQVAKDEGASYPFVIQWSVGCGLQPDGASRRFCDAGLNGEDFVSFDVDGGTWFARREDRLTRVTQEVLNNDKVVAATLQFLLNNKCVKLLRTFVQYGKEALERQERPVAVVFARASPPAGTPAPLLLVCRVTGFYPRPVDVAWLQDGEEVTTGWRLNSTGTLPNADLTYQRHSSLAVEPGDGHSYACRVDHSSLGGQSLLIPWDRGGRWGPGLVVGIVLGVLAVVAVAVGLGLSRRRGYQDIASGQPRPGGDGASPVAAGLGAGSAPGSRGPGRLWERGPGWGVRFSSLWGGDPTGQRPSINPAGVETAQLAPPQL